MNDKIIYTKLYIMYLKRFLFLLLFFLFATKVYSAGLEITKVTNVNNKLNVEFNNTLSLKDFTLIDDNLISPFYESKGNKYYFFYFLNRNLKNDIIKMSKG